MGLLSGMKSLQSIAKNLRWIEKQLRKRNKRYYQRRSRTAIVESKKDMIYLLNKKRSY